MKVFIEINRAADRMAAPEFRDYIRQLEDLGAAGVSLWDHLFMSEARPDREDWEVAADPLTTLAAVSAISDKLELQTVVMNSDWINPAFLLRQYAQLAVFAGGERVIAGLGAGWNVEEYRGIGEVMAPYPQRLRRLGEVLEVIHQQQETRWATLDGEFIKVHDLPMSPSPAKPYRVLLGGGSDGLLNLAGKYADVLDFHGDPKHGQTKGDHWGAYHLTVDQQRMLTTARDLGQRLELVRAASEAACLLRDAVDVNIQIRYVAFGDKQQVEKMEGELCAKWGKIPQQQLDQCPYLLLGEPQEIADTLMERSEVMGLRQICIQEMNNIPGAEFDPVRFCRDVTPLLR